MPGLESQKIVSAVKKLRSRHRDPGSNRGIKRKE